MLTGLFLILACVYFTLGFAVDLIVPRISPETEYQMASYFFRQKSDKAVSEKTRMVQDLADRMRKCSEIPYDLTVHVSESDQFNAMALPGGNILVFSKLLEKVESENELAFVLAHEMGHFANRDHLRGLGRSLVFMAISAVLFGGDSWVGALLGQSLNITEMSFSRKQETGADEYALNVLNCAYGHVGGSIDFFRKLGKYESKDIMPHYFSTHPESRKRISHLKKYGHSKGFSDGPVRPLERTSVEKTSVK